MAEMQTIFIETSLQTRLALTINENDHVLAFKDKFSKEHAMCFPDFGEITVSTLKVKWQDHFYHLSDSMSLSKVFENENCEMFLFVDVASVEKKLDPTHEEALQIQAAEDKTQKRKMKTSSSAKNSRKKLAHVPNESKDIENVTSVGDNQNQDGLDDDHVKDLNVDQNLEEAIEQDLEKGVTNASAAGDIVMIDQENDLEKVNLLLTAEHYKTTDAEDEGLIDVVDATFESLPNSVGEKVTITHVETIQSDDEKVDNGEEIKVVKLKKRTKSRKEKVVPKEDTLVDSTSPNAVVALTAPNVQHGVGEKVVKKSIKRSKKKLSDENNVEEGPVVSAE
ncbi:hypothetical protein V5N11_015916 [Cardamine amara subsp. amara]|uniref:Uncharacterized protein n=1 Tax=Cardamine amara subsp. amara TaxID=228776 RepID=A0ABD0ZNI0_CARAN